MEPCFDLVAQSGKESLQKHGLLLHSSVHDDYTSFVGQKDVGVSDRINLRGNLPEGESRFPGALGRQVDRQDRSSDSSEQADT